MHFRHFIAIISVSYIYPKTYNPTTKLLQRQIHEQYDKYPDVSKAWGFLFHIKII